MASLQPIQWLGDADTGVLRLLDQTRLPHQITYLDCSTVQQVWDAIKQLSVRGAPAIGVAAGYGGVLALREGNFEAQLDHLASSRPTAVNLFWALDRMKKISPRTPIRLLEEARLIHQEDAAMCQAIGEHGLRRMESLLGNGSSQAQPPIVLTHCNAGQLATGGIGTATAPIYLAHQKGLKFVVHADETRPLLQGARLTAFELQQAGVPVVLQCDNMAAALMQSGRVKLVIVGADRIAANGDTANKIGTYNLAILAQYHRIPFFVAAPTSTFDMAIADGSYIPIETRANQEVTHAIDRPLAIEGTQVFNPAFDVTPHELITAIITQRGIIEPVNSHTVRAMLS